MFRLRILGASVLAAPLTIFGGSTANAVEYEFDLPAGTACAFRLGIDVSGGNQRSREFYDSEGNVVRTITAGRGSDLTFVNLDTGESLSLRSNGSVTRTNVNPDGTTTVVSTGHNVLVFFPTDVPAGPSTTLYVGQVVYDVDAAGVFTWRRASGRTVDICAAIS